MNRLRYAKKRRLSGSCSMYPIEYTWISDPTNVMSMTKVSDSGSASSPRSSWKDPAGTQFHSVRCCARSSVGRPMRCRMMATPTRKDPQDMAVASSGPNLSVRRPPSSSTAAPSRGRAMSSHTNADAPLASTGASPLPSVMSEVTGAPYSFSRLASSTEAERRERKMAMMMANPTTTSAAATTMTNRAMT